MAKYSLPQPIPLPNPYSLFRGFNFIRPIKIENSGAALRDYQVKITLTQDNFPFEKCRPDGNDIRFRDESGEIVPYWIESWTTTQATIWCKVPFIPENDYTYLWMVYGNPVAESKSDGNAVFEVFDVQDIVGFWHFDESQWTGATGEVKDETGVNHGTAHGGATTTSDAKYGRAGLFDGTDDYVVIGTSTVFALNRYSLEAWIKASSGAAEIFCRRDGSYWYNANFLLFLQEEGKVHLSHVTESQTINEIEGVSDLRGAGWKHIVALYDGTNQKIYVDGVLENSGSAEDPQTGGSQSLVIGFDLYDISRYFNGTIDEVRIYNRALSPTDIGILSDNYMEKMGAYFNIRKYATPSPVVIV